MSLSEAAALIGLIIAGALVILAVIPPATPLSALGASAVCVVLGWLGSR